jgi:hypothetical protein
MVSEADVPTQVRMQMAHAHVQWVAQGRQVRLLHIKGLALDERLRWKGREGSDADILAPAGRAEELVDALQGAGWLVASTFRNGSAFEHAATLRHEEFGWADIHRGFPGLSGDPDETFDRLWADRGEREIGGFACAVPSLAAQTLVLLLHAARSPGGRAALDIETVWDGATSEMRTEVLTLVDHLQAHVGFAAAVGNLDAYRDHAEYPLWRVASRGGTRVEEWRARVMAAPTWRAALALVVRAPLVNVQHLQMVLWRPPTRREIVVEFFARPVRGLTEELRALRLRRTTGRGR